MSSPVAREVGAVLVGSAMSAVETLGALAIVTVTVTMAVTIIVTMTGTIIVTMTETIIVTMACVPLVGTTT